MNKKMKLVVDLDNTLIITEQQPNGEYKIICKRDELIKQINNMYDNGHEIIIYTARHWNLLKHTLTQLQECEIKCTILTMGKPVGNMYIDDRAITPEDFMTLFKEEKVNGK